MSFDLAIKSVYNFTLKAGTILGYGYKNATVQALLDFETASKYEDVTPMHASVYSQLGAGVPRNAKDLTYVKIKTSTGEIRILAMEWIAEQPTLVTTSNINVVISNMNLDQIPLLRQVLLQNGFREIEITTIEA